VTPAMIGGLGILALFVLMAIRVPIAFAMLAVGLAGTAALNGLNPALSMLATESFTVATSYELIVVPLFILMGNVATQAGMSSSLYDAAYAWIGRLRGGLASATIVGCAGFAALSGSSIASALTMGKVSIGEMDRFGYSPRLSTGVVAAGGTLGILIPPSTGFVLYAILTQQSIGRLFLAGVVPGILLALLFVGTVTLLCTIFPSWGPRGPRTNWTEKARATLGALPILAIILVSIGGIYTGIFSPIESSAVGAGLAIVLGFALRRLTLAGLWRAILGSGRTTATVMLILISAYILNPFISLTGVPHVVGEWLAGVTAGPITTLVLILLCYLVLGCFLEGLSMIVLTMPILYPIVIGLGFDPIWYGVIIVIVLEMAMISPPVGVNVFIVRSIAPRVPLAEIFLGVLPFWVAMILLVGILILFPALATYLPDRMMQWGFKCCLRKHRSF